MIDFNILHGLSTELFSAPDVVNPNLIIEEGCWYLCTDTAELFLGTLDDQGELILKKINQAPVDILAKKEEVIEVQTKLEKEVLPTIKETILPTVTELKETAATQEWVRQQGYLTEILFNTDQLVSNPIGNFSHGENVKGLTMAELFTKLLGLASEIEQPQGIVADIMANKRELYQFNDSVEVEKVAYVYTKFETAEDYEAAPTTSTFYQHTYRTDTGEEITESGYQHFTQPQESIYYMVMLPSSLVIGENVKIKAWSPSKNMWMDTMTELEGDPAVIAAAFAEVGLDMPTIPKGYTIWVDFSDVNPGNKVRYIITE